jgi:hypothetical protein
MVQTIEIQNINDSNKELISNIIYTLTPDIIIPGQPYQVAVDVFANVGGYLVSSDVILQTNLILQHSGYLPGYNETKIGGTTHITYTDLRSINLEVDANKINTSNISIYIYSLIRLRDGLDSSINSSFIFYAEANEANKKNYKFMTTPSNISAYVTNKSFLLDGLEQNTKYNIYYTVYFDNYCHISYNHIGTVSTL